MSEAPLLRVQDVSVRFMTEGGWLYALDEVSFDVPTGGAVALIGESGCGKSVAAHSILRLIPNPPGEVSHGRIMLDDRDLLTLSEREMQSIRGGQVAMVFQEPMTSLNPVYSVGAQIIEAVRLHRSVSRREARSLAIAALRSVGFPFPEERVDHFPHELSGGMRQRVMIAMALVCEPRILIADEPTTAVDSMVQAQLLALLRGLRDKNDMGLLLISHDFGVVSEVCDEVVVLYAGQVVERAPTKSILKAPAHPYTQGLLASIPPVGGKAYRVRGKKGRRLPTIEGTVPDLRDPPIGCRFRDRCEHAMSVCSEAPPDFARPDEPGSVRCWLHESGGQAAAVSPSAPSDKSIEAENDG